MRLVTVVEDDASQLGLRKPVQERRRGVAARGIEPHVEGLVTLKREAPPRLLELPRGHAQIQEDRARAADSLRGGGALETAEGRVREVDAVAERPETIKLL